jgi:prepilin peptidase CpaA
MSVPFSLAVLALLVTAAWCDIATRTIPNAIGLMLLITGAVARLMEGPSALALSAGTALVLFTLLLIAYTRRYIGGGDVKVMAGFAVGLSPFDSYRFLVATAIAGGILAIAYLMLARLKHSTQLTKRTSLLKRVIVVESWRIRRRGPLPYGVAIAAGGAFVLFHSGSF